MPNVHLFDRIAREWSGVEWIDGTYYIYGRTNTHCKKPCTETS
jgi:hypothetical protein